MVRNRNALQPEERQLIEITALEHDLIVAHVEKAAAAKTVGIAPLQGRPLAVAEQVLDDAGHLRAAEFDLEHSPDRVAADPRRHDHLVVGRVFGIQR